MHDVDNDANVVRNVNHHNYFYRHRSPRSSFNLKFDREPAHNELEFACVLHPKMVNKTKSYLKNKVFVNRHLKTKWIWQITCSNQNDEPLLQHTMRRDTQDRVNKDATTNKKMFDIHVFVGNSCRTNRTIKLSTINNFAQLRRRFRNSNQLNRLNLVIVGGNNLVLTPKISIADRDDNSNSSIPNNIDAPS